MRIRHGMRGTVIGHRLDLADQLEIQLLLIGADLIAHGALGLGVAECGVELVAAHPDVLVDPPLREDDPVAAECASGDRAGGPAGSERTMHETDHEGLADELDHEADELAHHSNELKGSIEDVRQDWEHKRADEGVPGAVPRAEGEGEGES